MATEMQGYEPKDANARGVAIVGAALALLVVVAMAAMYWLQPVLLDRVDEPWPLAERRIPPEPQLEVSITSNIRSLRSWEDEQLGNYGWVDRRLGRVRIPVERAMEIVVERGWESP